MVAQLRINKEVCTFRNFFRYFVQTERQKKEKGRQNARKNGKEKLRKRREISSSRRFWIKASHERKCFNESDHKDTFVFQHSTTTNVRLKVSVQMIPLKRSIVNVKFTL